MVEAGKLQIGGSINTANIERGLARVEDRMGNVKQKSQSANASFSRMSGTAGTLATTLGTMGMAATTGLAMIAKNAPATAGAMAKVQVAGQELKFAVGRALKDEFKAFSNTLSSLAEWVQDHPDMFSGIIKSLQGLAIIGIGGWVYKAVSRFSGLLSGVWGTMKKMVNWKGWSKVGKVLGKGSGGGTGGTATAGTTSALGTSAGVTTATGVAGLTQGMMLPPLINTYQRELGDQDKGFMDRKLQQLNDFFEFSWNANSRKDFEERIENSVTI